LGFKKGEARTAEQEKYAINNLKYLPEIMKQQQAKIKLLDLENIIDIEMKAIPAVVWLELSGIYVNLEKFKEIKDMIQNQYQESEAFLQKKLITYDKPDIPQMYTIVELICLIVHYNSFKVKWIFKRLPY
jgi:DNA polymerase I